MAKKSLNKNLHDAKSNKKDEFYTQLADIEKELRHYKEHFKNKTVLCNCDDPRVSNFFHYFSYNFEVLGLKKLITTCYKNQNAELFSDHKSEKAIYLEYYGDKNDNRVPDPEEIGIKHLEGDGDFRSAEVKKLRDEADIIITNPPFSLFREFLAWILEADKKFVIIGNLNAITYKEIFPLIMTNQIWLGNGFKSGNAFFLTPFAENYGQGVYMPESGLVKFRNTSWYTNLDHGKRHKPIPLMSYEDNLKYSNHKEIKGKSAYDKYDNYDAIEVPFTDSIPSDYEGVMGVPISFLDKYNPEQFEILGATESEGKGFSNGLWDETSNVAQATVKGNRVYKRLFIRNRQVEAK